MKALITVVFSLFFLTACGGEEKLGYVYAPQGVDASDYENQMKVLTDSVNTLSQDLSLLTYMSDKTVVEVSSANFYKRMTPVFASIQESFYNLDAIIDPKDGNEPDPNIDISGFLERVHNKTFGMPRDILVSLSSIPESGLGLMKVNGNVFRFAMGPGLLESSILPQKVDGKVVSIQPKELVAVMQHDSGGYQIALGIIYPGQTEVVLTWDPRIFYEVEGYLDYHNFKKGDERFSWLLFE